ncbi:potassium transporter [Bermanella marisrubri]|uniref:Glutathione-regulated potassium-efflux system protein KefC n=1 Tax=Bermanella marisrubri TaxID=207949 RepID=Q1MZA2_9GAMM|nr:monovalent cation:proton antiporter-2 (CPA2) family protein [Bermanella marisrubri]EAT11364.1 glutathione-regulated potassium-efflux system protein KefC [Oceanobacter sp. RED65] [Bermanella marisrubri]QIZ85250.1 potassium transporter [Bermanella marisrubri]
MTEYFIQAFIYLCAAVIAVPLARRLGLGSVLGYLIAGLVIGPVLGLVGSETDTIQHFAEFGVVMMLFLVGLELDPKELWGMRNRLLGLGGLQVALTTILVAIIAWLAGLNASTALSVGLIFSLSSTAIVLQTFNEKQLTKTEGAKTSFSVLLFQDIAVIPMLALLPLLASSDLMESATAAAGHGAHGYSLVDHLSGWSYGLVVLAAIGFVVVGGHYLSYPLFRFIADSGLREMFTTSALFIVIGIAALMSLVGLSPALGAFLAGVVLANSEFRPELESHIEPFKGLLLGLFFITVGAGINLNLLQQEWFAIAAMTIGIILVKGIILYGLGRIFNVYGSNLWLFTLAMAQAGEFGFVLLNFSAQNFIISNELKQLLSLPVALSMFLTPGLFIFYEKVVVPNYRQKGEQKADEIEEQHPVIIAGSGRFGQIVNRLLIANDIPTTVLDYQSAQVDLMRRINIKSYFGDASDPKLLHTAGIEEASMVVVAIDQRDQAVDMVRYIRSIRSDIRILARAFDRGHGYTLEKSGADCVISETYHSALQLGRQALVESGMHPFSALQNMQTFEELERKQKPKLYKVWRETMDDGGFTSHYRELFMELEKQINHAMDEERDDAHAKSERGWTPPPKNYEEGLLKELDDKKSAD